MRSMNLICGPSIRLSSHERFDKCCPTPKKIGSMYLTQIELDSQARELHFFPENEENEALYMALQRWAIPKYSKAVVDKAGAWFNESAAMPVSDAIDVISNWRYYCHHRRYRASLCCCGQPPARARSFRASESSRILQILFNPHNSVHEVLQ